MESLRFMIDLMPPRTPSDAKFITEDEIKELFLSFRFFATFAVNVFYIIGKNSFLRHSKFSPRRRLYEPEACNRYSLFGFNLARKIDAR